MKTVFSNSMCAHVWGQQSQSVGRSSSMSFEGPTIYSYITPIARFTKTASGLPVVLITSRTYSMTTSSKHMPQVRRAVSHIRRHFVEDLGVSGGQAYTHNHLIGEMAKTHAANLEELTTKYKEWAGKLLRFNAWGATDVESIASQLQGMAQEALDYAADFALAAPVFDLVGDAAKISARRVRLDASRNSPATIAKREREEKRKEEKRRAALAESIAKLANDIAEWRAGTLDRLYATDIDGGAMLRIRGNNVETSQGASAPISHAARVLQAINVSRKYGRDTWTRSQSSQRDGTTLGHFTLDSYDASGIRAGCHFITWKEIDAIAPRILERAQPFTMAG